MNSRPANQVRMTGAAFRIMERKENKNERVLEALASESGVAIVVLDKQGNERAAANNNSICQTLYPSDFFCPRCA